MTEQSAARWRSILILGSSPGGMGTGSLHSGPRHDGVEADRDGGQKTGPTVGSYSIILSLIVLRAVVRLRFEMVGTEGICAVLTFKG